MKKLRNYRTLVRISLILTSSIGALALLGACNSPLPTAGAWQQIHLRDRIQFYFSQGFAVAASILQFDTLSRNVHSKSLQKVNENIILIWFRLDKEVTAAQVNSVLSGVIGAREEFLFSDNDGILKLNVEIARVGMFRDFIDLKLPVLEFTANPKGFFSGGSVLEF